MQEAGRAAMKEKYREIMDRVRVTDTMHDEIIRGALGAGEHTLPERRKRQKRKAFSRGLVAAACACTAAVACLLALPSMLRHPPAQPVYGFVSGASGTQEAASEAAVPKESDPQSMPAQKNQPIVVIQGDVAERGQDLPDVSDAAAGAEGHPASAAETAATGSPVSVPAAAGRPHAPQHSNGLSEDPSEPDNHTPAPDPENGGNTADTPTPAQNGGGSYTPESASEPAADPFTPTGITGIAPVHLHPTEYPLNTPEPSYAPVTDSVAAAGVSVGSPPQVSTLPDPQAEEPAASASGTASPFPETSPPTETYEPAAGPSPIPSCAPSADPVADASLEASE